MSGEHAHPVDPDAVARARRGGVGDAYARHASTLFSLLADPGRVRTLYALRGAGELCVGDLALALGVSEDAAGYAVRRLRSEGLVVTRKEGRMVFHRLPEDFPMPLLEHCLGALVDLGVAARGAGGHQETP